MSPRFERGIARESLDASIARVAAAYGFTTPPVNVSKRAHADQSAKDPGTALTTAVVKGKETAKKPTQLWGSTRRSGGTLLSFTVLASRHAISHALVVKTALSIAELAGYSDLVVGVSSIGDQESRRRFIRELGTFFRKHASVLPHDVLKLSSHNTESAYKEVLSRGGDLAERLPKPIDFLSENSRKTMVEALHLFEEVGIQYELVPHLPSENGVHAELLFAISGVNAKSERVIVATGGRMDELMKKHSPTGHSVGIALTVPETLEFEPHEGQLSCFVVHVGEAAKLKAFQLTESLWRANVALEEALLSETLREQMDDAKARRARYIAIIGQREALDNTVIVRNRESGMQQVLAQDKLAAHVSRGQR